MTKNDLLILEIAADIIDETGRATIANQVRKLKDRIDDWLRQNEERERAWQEGDHPKIVISESPLHRNLEFWHTLQVINSAQDQHRLHSASEAFKRSEE